MMKKELIVLCAAIFMLPAAASGETLKPAAVPSGLSRAETLSKADMLAKAGEHDAALALLQEYLSRNPSDTDAQLLYARTFSWKGEYDWAIAIYSDVLRREPGNAEAHAGVGRVRSWRGEYDTAVESFRRSLGIDPGSVETRTALARTLWWKGDAKEALKELGAIIEKDPGNSEALGLERRLRNDKGPSARGVYLNASDSDNNRMEAYQAYFTSTLGLPRHRFELGYKRFVPSVPGRDAAADILDLRDSIKTGKVIVAPRLSFVSTDTDAGSRSYLTEGLSLSSAVDKRTALVVSYNRYPLLDTVTLVENNIKVREAAIALTSELKRGTFSASASHSSYSDGNSRYDLAAGLAANLMKEPRLVAGFTSEYRDFSEKKTNGYFNPPHIFSNSVYVDSSGRLTRALIYRGKASLGVQSHDRNSEYATSFQAGLEWEATRDLSLEALWKYSRSALESASGFRYEELRFGVNYLF